jgi:hypothetical protein
MQADNQPDSPVACKLGRSEAGTPNDPACCLKSIEIRIGRLGHVEYARIRDGDAFHDSQQSICNAGAGSLMLCPALPK